MVHAVNGCGWMCGWWDVKSNGTGEGSLYNTVDYYLVLCGSYLVPENQRRQGQPLARASVMAGGPHAGEVSSQRFGCGSASRLPRLALTAAVATSAGSMRCHFRATVRDVSKIWHMHACVPASEGWRVAFRLSHSIGLQTGSSNHRSHPMTASCRFVSWYFSSIRWNDAFPRAHSPSVLATKTKGIHVTEARDQNVNQTSLDAQSRHTIIQNKYCKPLPST